MRNVLMLASVALAASLASPAAAQTARTYAATEVQLRDVAAVVRIHPEARHDVAVTVTNAGILPDPEFRVVRAKLTIDGGLRRRVSDCSGDDDAFSVQISGVGRVSGANLPVIDIRTPERVVVSAGGGVRLSVGPSESATVRLEGCGQADIERVAGEAVVAVSGAPDLRLYEAGSATVALAGAGDVTVGVVHSELTVSIAGAGDFVAARADGRTSIAIQGAGDVIIRDGRATTLSVAIAGSGDVVHNGSAERLDAAILGAGDVRVARVDGEVTRRIVGGGDVVVGRR